MLGLSFPEDGFHYDFLLIFIDFKRSLLLNIPRLALGYSVTEHQDTQLRLLLVVVVWSDLVKPKTHILGIVLSPSSDLNVLFRFLFEFNNHLIFSLAPGRVKRTFDVVVAIFVVSLSLLSHFGSHALTCCTSSVSTTLVFVLLVALFRALFIIALLVKVAATLAEFGVDFANRFLRTWLSR